MAVPQQTICAHQHPNARQCLAAYRTVRDMRWAAIDQGQPATPAGLLAAAGLNYRVQDADLDSVPKSGPVLVAVESPFEIADGLALAALLPGARKDVRILANYVLAEVPGFESVFLATDPWPGPHRVPTNRRAIAEAVRWLEGDGLLVVFPAGDRNARRAASLSKSPWSTTPLRLARLTGAPILPVALSPAAPVNDVELRIGRPIPWQRLAVIGPDEVATAYIRWHAAALKRRDESPRRLVPRLAF